MKTQFFFSLFFLLSLFAVCPARENIDPETDTSAPIATIQPSVADNVPTADIVPARDNRESRDPFSRVSSEVIKPDHDRAAQCCKLRGIIKVGGRSRGLFVIGGKADNADNSLHPLAPGDTLRVVIDKREYIFTISRFTKHSAVITGENDKFYQVRL